MTNDEPAAHGDHALEPLDGVGIGIGDARLVGQQDALRELELRW